MGITGKIAESRRRKLAEFIEGGHLEEGERVEAALPMLQTRTKGFGHFYGVVVTPRRVLLAQWARTPPERLESLIDAVPREQVAVKAHQGGMLMGRLALTRQGEPWVDLKIPRNHREDSAAVAAALGAGAA
jgi:hypothetical protein